MLENEDTGGEQEAAPAVNETEQKAREQGWVPKDEWQGEGRWRDAEAFLDRGELFQKIDAQRRQVKELQKTQDAFTSHLKVVREAEFKRALETLRAEKRAALVEGDPDALITVDDKIRHVERQALENQRAEVAPQDGTPHPDFVEWQSRNTWYADSNRAMKAFADVEGNKLARQGLSPTEVLAEIEKQVRKEFPEKFTNPNRARPGAVEGTAGKGGSQRETVQLDEHERNVMNRLIKSGVMTKEEYIKDLQKVKGR
jgi:hypothetical protein